jgi:hypothetical protein
MNPGDEISSPKIDAELGKTGMKLFWIMNLLLNKKYRQITPLRLAPQKCYTSTFLMIQKILLHSELQFPE